MALFEGILADAKTSQIAALLFRFGRLFGSYSEIDPLDPLPCLQYIKLGRDDEYKVRSLRTRIEKRIESECSTKIYRLNSEKQQEVLNALTEALLNASDDDPNLKFPESTIESLSRDGVLNIIRGESVNIPKKSSISDTNPEQSLTKLVKNDTLNFVDIIELLRFLSKHPYTRFSRSALVLALRNRTVEVERSLKYLVDAQIAIVDLDEKIPLFSLSPRDSKNNWALKLGRLNWYQWQEMLMRAANTNIDSLTDEIEITRILESFTTVEIAHRF